MNEPASISRRMTIYDVEEEICRIVVFFAFVSCRKKIVLRYEAAPLSTSKLLLLFELFADFFSIMLRKPVYRCLIYSLQICLRFPLCHSHRFNDKPTFGVRDSGFSMNLPQNTIVMRLYFLRELLRRLFFIIILISSRSKSCDTIFERNGGLVQSEYQAKRY